MAKGNASLIKDIIDDTKTSTQTTFSSDKLEKLINAGNADIVYLTVSATAPTIASSTDIYYNSTTKLIYKVDNNAWNTGEAPKANTLYIGTNNKKVYLEDAGALKEVSGGSGDVKVSTKDGNAIETVSGSTDPNEDGIFVEDLSQKVNQINIAQKTVNETLDHAEFKLAGNTLVSKINQLIPFTELIDGNMKLNESNHISLKANHSYQIMCNLCYQDTSRSSFANIEYAFVDDSNNKIIQFFQPYKGDNKFEFSSTVAFQYTPTRDCGLYMKTINVYNVDIIESSKTTLTIQEIGRVTTIDPVNYVDTTQGIQDVPVGTLIEVEGPQNPDHYLLCDGSTYNIEDYRYLAEAIKKVYGKYNYFGGDGVNTFAVPMHTDTDEWFSPKQTSNTNPYTVSASSNYNNWQIWWGFNNNCTTSASNAWHSAVGSSTGHWVQIDFKVTKALAGISMAPRPEGNYKVSRMPRDFDIMGSNDSTTWNIIKSYTGINDYENYKYREFIFDAPVRYRYYRIANIRVTDSCVNIADIHFLSVPKKYVYIKYEPTYFIGTINGYEERKTLMDTPVLIPCTNGMLKPGTEIPLSESLDNYDYVEVHVGADYAGIPFGKHVTRIPTSEIIYSPTKTEWMNTYQEWICDQNTSFALWYGFKDAQTLYVGRIQANVNSNPDNYRGCQIIKIVGIRNKYKVIE